VEAAPPPVALRHHPFPVHRSPNPVPSPRPRPRATFTLLLGALVLLVGLGAPGLAAARTPLVGIQSDEPGLATVKAVGARLTRIEVSWAAVEPRASGVREPAAVAEIDAYVAAAATRGIKPIIFFDQTPCWASSAPAAVRGDCSGPGANRADVSRYAPADPKSAVPFATFLAQRYGSRIAALQLWNEPDQANEKYWAGTDKVRRYVRFTKAVYPAVKAVAPQLPVLAGSFVGADGRWLTALYRAGWKGSYDGIAVQFYDLPLWALRTTRAVQRRYHDRRTPLWLTEFGYTSCAGGNGRPSFLADHPCVTRAVQAQNLVDLLAGLRHASYVRAAVMYFVRDQSRAYQFGVVDSAGRRKPAFAKLRRAIRSHAKLRSGRVRLVRRGGGVRVTGNVPGLDLYTLRAYVRGTLAFRAVLRTDRLNRISLALPKVLGTTGLRVTLTSGWTGRRITARR
jgi:hypothetical protein